MMKRIAIGCLMAGLLAAAISPCYGYFEPSPWTKETSYNQKMFGKLAFGFKNTTMGFVEIFSEPYEAVRDNGMFWKGVGRGLFNGVVDTVGGALHLATFYLTPLDIPLPEGGVSYL